MVNIRYTLPAVAVILLTKSFLWVIMMPTELKKKLYVAYCKRGEFPYWLVMKSRPRDVYASTVKREAEDLLLFGPDLPDFDEEKPDATHLIKEFVESGFDMKILEQWSSQKNT